VNTEASTVWKGLQQANNVTPERDSDPRRRRSCCDLQPLTVVDAIGNRIIVAATGNAGSGDYQFVPPAAAANRKRHSEFACIIA
jgi:hypothetical protein